MATEAPPRRRKFWGWGYEDQQPPHEEVEAAAAGIVAHLGFGANDVERPVRVEDLDLPEPRLAPPSALAGICAADPHARASHALGKAYRDVVRAFRGQVEHPPDVVAFPRDEQELEQVLDWCGSAGAAAIPYGGGTSVVGGVEPRFEQPAVSVDLERPDRRARGRPGLAGRSDRRRDGRAGAGGRAARARPDAPPLPAVIRALHAGRVDRHPRRRALRHRADPHRRPGRVGARADAAGACGRAAGCPARARGRAPTAC